MRLFLFNLYQMCNKEKVYARTKLPVKHFRRRCIVIFCTPKDYAMSRSLVL